MNRKYNLKLDLQFRCNNSIMKFNQFDNNTSDFFIKISSGGKSFDVGKAIVVLATIKPSGKVSSQFIEVENDVIYADLKPNMRDEIGIYTAQAMLILEDERVVTDVISYEVEEDKIFSLLNDTVGTSEEFTLLTDMLSRLSAIEISEEQRVINEAERILSEENRKIEEAKRVEAELIRQHEEADRVKYDATRESNENIRKQNESIRLANEANRIDEETKRVEEENKRKLAEEERNANYNFMTEDEERRRLEANAHKETEALRVQAETNRVNEEAKRRTTEQARVSAENTRVSNENIRKTNEEERKSNETQRVEAETQRKNRYNSFISDAETNANNFENYTNTAKVKEEERKSNELDRRTQEAKRVSNEVERISNENTRKANEAVREKNETSRQYVFENKVNEVDKKIIEINTTKDNFVSSVNTKVDTKISELDKSKSDMTNTVTNKIDEVETRFNALTSSQQQDAEVIDARDGETSLKARLDRDIEKAKQVYVNVEGSNISTDSSVGYVKDIEILGNTVQDASNLADIRSVGDKVEGQELYEIPVLSCGKNLLNIPKHLEKNMEWKIGNVSYLIGYVKLKPNTDYTFTGKYIKSIDEVGHGGIGLYLFNSMPQAEDRWFVTQTPSKSLYVQEAPNQTINKSFNSGEYKYFAVYLGVASGSTHNYIATLDNAQLEEGAVATPYEPYVEDKLTILSPTPLEKVGDVADRLICKDGVWGVEDNSVDILFNETNCTITMSNASDIHPNYAVFDFSVVDNKNYVKTSLLFCNKFNHLLYSADRNSSDKEGCWIGNAVFFTVKILKSKLESVDVNGMKKWLKTNNINLKYLTTQPQFIPLSHNQQIKLRTFANKTNISFGCEIEGMIKAQVPKSLGATVNTHTEQINNLNKELDRVKKLEESTVSTVTTESDFTTVEQTTNGYFEDVKLEGKTLVNLYQATESKHEIVNANANFNNGVVTLEGAGKEIMYRCPKDTLNVKPNTKYTLILNVLETNYEGSLKNAYCGNRDKFSERLYLDFSKIGVSVYTFKTKEDFTDNVLWDLYMYFNNQTNATIKFTMIILEGDHTQNPPSYFEGLKSVSEDTDEISVKSVKNLLDYTKLVNKVTDGTTGFITINNNRLSLEVKDRIEVYSPQISVKCRDVLVAVIGFVEKDGVPIYDSGYLPLNTTSNLSLPSEVKYITINSKIGNETPISKEALKNVFIYHLSDKKSLLYFDTETQTWEKPTLREWDSIEKHANGKYYYHQRSAEVVLNGSENWGLGNSSNDTTLLMYVKPSEVPKSYTWGICDKFNFQTSNNVSIRDTEYIFVDTDINIRIDKTKLPTQNIAGFKQWLQANNLTLVYQLAEEKVYECTNIDLITYNGETNFIVESGVLSPRTTLKVHNNISNVVSLLQKKVSLLESNVTSYMITQNRLMLASRYNADNVTFKVDYPSMMSEREVEIDYDLFKLIQDNIIVGPENYDVDKMLEIMDLYAMIGFITWEMWDYLYEVIDIQINPVIGDLEGAPEI